eukprot:5263668-Amphidinium_carterae.1
MLLESGVRTPRQSASRDWGEGKAGSVAKLKDANWEPQMACIIECRWVLTSATGAGGRVHAP